MGEICATAIPLQQKKTIVQFHKQLGTFSKGCRMLPDIKTLCVLTLEAWHLVHRGHVRLLPVVNSNAVHAQPLSATGCRKQMASLALYLAKRRPISFPTKDVRSCLLLHNSRPCSKSRTPPGSSPHAGQQPDSPVLHPVQVAELTVGRDSNPHIVAGAIAAKVGAALSRHSCYMAFAACASERPAAARDGTVGTASPPHSPALRPHASAGGAGQCWRARGVSF